MKKKGKREREVRGRECCGIWRDERVERGMRRRRRRDEEEVGKQSNNFGVWELQRRIDQSEFSLPCGFAPRSSQSSEPRDFSASEDERRSET
ncbi:hypothetical protein JOB18_008388 [Solea senegalensis]|uniref:Uncharacterized protein n=1 Tax=Solea senegalensis TaxID=28829 RepID=A0AAV6QV90_SOLSE|nr:hypothetical protein JOB18_008388 [Solea senegalensis]